MRHGIQGHAPWRFEPRPLTSVIEKENHLNQTSMTLCSSRLFSGVFQGLGVPKVLLREKEDTLILKMDCKSCLVYDHQGLDFYQYMKARLDLQHPPTTHISMWGGTLRWKNHRKPSKDIYRNHIYTGQFTFNSKSHGIVQKDFPGPEKDLKKGKRTQRANKKPQASGRFPGRIQHLHLGWHVKGQGWRHCLCC